MANLILCHGFNVHDAGKATIDKLLPFLAWHNIQQADYGYFNLLAVRFFNDNIAGVVAGMSLNKSIGIGHSNGCAVLVNAARGEIVDEPALTRMLADREIAGAGLDVFEHEPAVNPKLLELQNAVLLPHMGSATIEGRVDMGEKVLINIKTFVDGHTPPDRVIEGLL